jgi:hypothetical protein
MRFLARLYGWPAVQRYRDKPLWDVGEGDKLSGWPGDKVTEQRRSSTESEVSPPPHPLTPSPPHPLTESVAQALVDIGISEGDEAILRGVAQRISEL